jgi:hypothetical protein
VKGILNYDTSANNIPSVKDLKPCALCGEFFKPKRSDAKFCSAAHKQKAWRCRLSDPAPIRNEPKPCAPVTARAPGCAGGEGPLHSVSSPSTSPPHPKPKITVCPPGERAIPKREWSKILINRSPHSRKYRNAAEAKATRRKIEDARLEEREMRAREREREIDQAGHVGGGVEAGVRHEAEKLDRAEAEELRAELGGGWVTPAPGAE